MSDIQQLLARRDAVLGPAYRHFYREPIHMVRGKDVWMYDVDGNAYLDTYNNVPHIGHSHPAVVKAVQEQMAQLNIHTRYLHETIVEYSEKLLEHFEEPLDTTLYCCSGTEANEIALRLARYHTGNKGVIVMDCAYHGHSQSIYEISTRDVAPELMPDYVATIPAPDALRGPYRGADAGEKYAAHVQEAVETLQGRGYGVAALIIDTIQSSGGTIIPPAGYFAKAAEIVRAAGGLFIADEVQAGFGRIGDAFWAYQPHGVTPDFVTMGKPMGNGMPLAGCVTRREYTVKFSENNKYFNTFAGIPVTCAAGLAMLNAMEADNLQENARCIGLYLKDGLTKLADRFEVIGDIRGSGCFIGLDLVEDRATLAPATQFTTELIEKMKEHRVLSGAIGPSMNILKIRPAMTFTQGHADQFLDVIEQSLTELT